MVDAIGLFEFRRRRKSCSDVRWTSTMYTVHQESGAYQGETPGIGESPSSQPISGPVIFSKRQALSRAVVVNSNMSRGKYLAREGPGSRLRPKVHGHSASRGCAFLAMSELIPEWHPWWCWLGKVILAFSYQFPLIFFLKQIKNKHFSWALWGFFFFFRFWSKSDKRCGKVKVLLLKSTVIIQQLSVQYCVKISAIWVGHFPACVCLAGCSVFPVVVVVVVFAVILKLYLSACCWENRFCV